MDASIQQILSVAPHPNADRLDLVMIKGFQCVTQRGLYTPGDIVVYIQPDSVLPDSTWAESYKKYSPSRVKAFRLRGEWTKGIIVSKDALTGFLDPELFSLAKLGQDVSDLLAVTHYQPKLPNDESAVGSLPFCIPKTDEERVENLEDYQLPIGEQVDITLKIDGQSCSFYYNLELDKFGVIGRTLELDPAKENKYTRHVAKYDIENKLRNYCKKNNVSLCLRGESYGPGINANKHNPWASKDPGWMMFSVFNINTGKYERLGSEFYFENVAKELNLPAVPIVEKNVIFTKDTIAKYSDLTDSINGESFEGVVINHGEFVRERESYYINADGQQVKYLNQKVIYPGSFKIINNQYDSLK